MGRQLLKPAFHIFMETRLIVIYEYRGGYVHRIAKQNPFLDPGLLQSSCDLPCNVDKFAFLPGHERQFRPETFHVLPFDCSFRFRRKTELTKRPEAVFWCFSIVRISNFREIPESGSDFLSVPSMYSCFPKKPVFFSLFHEFSCFSSLFLCFFLIFLFLPLLFSKKCFII